MGHSHVRKEHAWDANRRCLKHRCDSSTAIDLLARRSTCADRHRRNDPILDVSCRYRSCLRLDLPSARDEYSPSGRINFSEVHAPPKAMTGWKVDETADRTLGSPRETAWTGSRTWRQGHWSTPSPVRQRIDSENVSGRVLDVSAGNVTAPLATATNSPFPNG